MFSTDSDRHESYTIVLSTFFFVLYCPCGLQGMLFCPLGIKFSEESKKREKKTTSASEELSKTKVHVLVPQVPIRVNHFPAFPSIHRR
jgi:hypothetical protein